MSICSALLHLDFGGLLAPLVLGFPSRARAAFREHYFVLNPLVVKIRKVNSAACIEQDVSCTTHYLVLIGAC